MEEIKKIISQMTEIELYGNKNLVVYFNLVYNKDNDKNSIDSSLLNYMNKNDIYLCYQLVFDNNQVNKLKNKIYQEQIDEYQEFYRIIQVTPYNDQPMVIDDTDTNTNLIELSALNIQNLLSFEIDKFNLFSEKIRLKRILLCDETYYFTFTLSE
jgi:hypothetical protein